MPFKLTQILLILSLLYAEHTYSQNDTLKNDLKKFYYENGNLSSEGKIIKGLPEGLWKTYFIDGQLKTIGERKNNKLQGEWYFYRDNGELERIINYNEGIKSGIEEEYDIEGFLTSSYTYLEDKKNGEAIYLYKDGSHHKELNFINGKEEGKGIEYGTDGRVIAFMTYSSGYIRSLEKVNRYNSKGEKIARWIEYWPGNNRVKEEGNYSNGKRNGLFKIYKKNGNLDRIETYKNGILQKESDNQVLDVKKELGQDGKVKSIGSYSNGKKQGIFREYNSEGEITSSAIYNNGVKTGEGIITGSGDYEGSWKLFYPTGEIKAEGGYEVGNKEGKWNFYYVTGELEQKGSYKNNKAHSEWIWYFKSGEIKREEYYRKGREDGESVEFREDGSKINTGIYIDGLRTGKWFLTQGDYEEKGEFIDDEKNGKWKSFYKKTDRIYFEGEYSLGVPIKKHIYYYSNGSKKIEGKHSGGERHGDWKFYNKDGTIRLLIRYTNGLETRLNGEKL